MKKQLGEDMVNFIKPIREKTLDIQTNTPYLHKIMKMGQEKARESASKTLDEARKKMGINFYC
jgi:tryptophanyl-tRNA synthetase